jgi:hypothetical protein
MNIEKGRIYQLKTFNGTIKKSSWISENENYWKLIGQFGTAINFASELGFHDNDRVLFEFKIDIVNKGLECHNEKPNSLWILKTDLK